APTRAALAGVGFALAGAALTRALDIAAQRRAEAAQAQASRLRDLDETRRLAYAILNARRSRDGVIIATLASALAHHGLAADPNVAAQHVASVLNALALPQKVSNGSGSRLTALLPSSTSRPGTPPPVRQRHHRSAGQMT